VASAIPSRRRYLAIRYGNNPQRITKAMNSTIACPHCGQTNPGGTLFCTKCNARFPGADDAATIVGPKDSAGKAGRSVFASAAGLSDSDATMIGSTPLPPLEAVDIVRQICQALDAAHSEGVVHRDLKPQNIMMDHTGRVVVMDFGIAHSKEMPGMTMTGALMGTPEYMSPEQAKGEKTDLRADIFAVGIIFYEMLTGKIPFKADTV